MENKCYLFFSGYHSVAAASDLLSRFHIENSIVRAPAVMNRCCSFAVLINTGDYEMTRTVLGDKDVKMICR